jgi:hypothetical protein
VTVIPQDGSGMRSGSASAGTCVSTLVLGRLGGPCRAAVLAARGWAFTRTNPAGTAASFVTSQQPLGPQQVAWLTTLTLTVAVASRRAIWNSRTYCGLMVSVSLYVPMVKR